MQRNAVISGDGRYRYRLTRRWDPSLTSMGFIMLNPSTADSEVDDPTIRRCINFARREGFGGIDVRNLFALRSTDPSALRIGSNAGDPGGPGNDEYLIEMVRQFDVVVAAWGSWWYDCRMAVTPRRYHIEEFAQRIGKPLHCLGTTKKGYPRHPLYLPNDAPLTTWEFPT